MPHPGRNNIYEATIKRMVTQALEAQEQEFVSHRGSDSNEQLLSYLRDCAALLHHTPWPREIVGGSMIALQEAQLPWPRTPDKVTSFARYQAETERQKVLYRQKKAAKKLRAQQRLKTQKE